MFHHSCITHAFQFKTAKAATQAPKVNVKKEVLSPDDLLKAEIAASMVHTNSVAEELSDMETQANRIYPLAKANELLATYAEALMKHIDQVSKLRRGVSAIVRGNTMSQEKMPMLIETIKKVRTRHTTMVDFAVLNGIEETKKRGNKKRGNKVE